MNKKAVLLSFLGGFFSLSIEVVYIRLMSFTMMSLPQAFSLTLAIFLLGIAFGSLIGKRLCQQNKASVETIGFLFLMAAAFDLFALASFMLLPKSLPWLQLCVLITAMLRGIVFPVVHHLGTEKAKTGAAISNVYFANVLGCTMSPILVGFYLFDFLNTQQSYALIIACTFVIAFFCLPKKAKAVAFACSIVSLSVIAMPEKMMHSLAIQPEKLETLIENKHGFIQVYQPQKGDLPHEKIVFGNNVYDGALNVNLFRPQVNGIHRAYMLPVIKPDAEEVLVIGLSTGSWVEVIATMPKLKKIIVVELNPAYTEFASFYPEMARLLKDPRVEIIADDGRRWLARHNQKFDYILMNTTWSWRNYSSNLLSQEFLTMIKDHLKPGGFTGYNTTGFVDSFHTAKSVFNHVYQFNNFLFAMDMPLPELSDERIQSVLKDMRWAADNQPVFKTEEEIQQANRILTAVPIQPYEVLELDKLLGRELEIITDFNMIPEYKYGKLSDYKAPDILE